MPSEESWLRVEICENCYEHEKTDKHAQTPFLDSFTLFAQQCEGLGIKVSRNVYPKYLNKIGPTKASSKRFVDTNTGKVVQFPRKGSFEIYYLNILVFSKLESGTFPPLPFVISILKELQSREQANPTLVGFERFRNIEYEFKRDSLHIQSLYSCIRMYCSDNCTQKQLQIAMNRIKNQSHQERKHPIYPYSFYAQKERKGKMESIYCPGNSNTQPLVQPNQQSKPQCLNLSKNKFMKKSIKSEQRKKKGLFSLALNGRNQGQTQGKTFQNVLSNLQKVNSPQKELYFSYLDYSKKITDNSVKEMKTHRRLESGTKPKGIKIRAATATARKDNLSQREPTKKSPIAKIFTDRKIKDMKKVVKDQQNKVLKQKGENRNKNSSYASQSNQNFDKIQSKEKVEQHGEQIQIMPILQKEEGRVKEEKSLINSEEEEETKNEMREDKIKLFEKASISKKFSEAKNFEANFQSENISEIQLLCKFDIGEQIYKKFQILSVKEGFKQRICLFPQKQNIEVGNNYSKFAIIVKYLVTQNPSIITRLFDNNKLVNPEGVYSIWLMNSEGVFQPVYIDDKFAFDVNNNKPIYGQIEGKNSIWFMLLEKAVAKIMGGYHRLSEAPLSSILNALLGCPHVDFGVINCQKILKIFEGNVLNNRLSTFYIYSESLPGDKKLETVVGFNRNSVDPNESEVMIKGNSQKYSLSLKEFLLKFDEIVLIFFSPHYFINQKSLSHSPKSHRLTCRISSRSQINDSYLVFHCLPLTTQTKVTVYRHCSQEIPESKGFSQRNNPKYQYVGEICKTGTFFFQLRLEVGEYICIIENKNNFSSDVNVSIFSENPVRLHGKEVGQYENWLGHSMNKAPSVVIEKKVFTSSKANYSQISKRSQRSLQVRKEFLVKDDGSEKENQDY